MLTYKDLRKERKGIVLLNIEIFSIVGLFLYLYFFEISISFFSYVLTMSRSHSNFLKLIVFLLIFALFSYVIYYTDILGFLFQVNMSFPIGVILSDIFSSRLFLTVSCCFIFNLGCYYIQIMRPIRISRKQYAKDQEANGITQYKYLGSMVNGQNLLNRLLDRYDSLNNRAMHIFSNMRSSGKTYPDQFSFLSKQILSTKQALLNSFTDLCEANDQEFASISSDIRICLDEFDSDICSLHTLFTLHLSNQNNPSRANVGSKPKKQIHEDSSSNTISSKESFDFFLGCDDLATLKKRYRDLMKAYHSDGFAGNEQISKDINLAYDEAKKRFL